MSMLLEKRKSVAEKLERLMNERQENINVKLNIYKEQLENEPFSEEIINTQTVLSAIDDIIKYENEALAKIEVVENLEVKEEVKEEKIEEEKIEEVKEDQLIEEIKEDEEIAEEIKEAEEEKVEEKVEDIQTEEVKTEEAPIEVEIKVDEEGKPEIKAEPIEARPGMAYIGIPERR